MSEETKEPKKNVLLALTADQWAAIKIAAFKANTTPSKVAAKLLVDWAAEQE